MANTISSNMNLVIPGVGTEPGPTYASDVNASLTLIDGHNHSSGSGVQITPAGININADLTIGSNNLISARSLRFAPQGSAISGPSDLGCLYEVTNDLFYNDGLGNQIRLTQGGSIAGTSGSIANLVSPASASYVSISSTFVWQSAANTPANMDAASYVLRNLVANSKGLTLSPPAAMAADYSIVLPSLPGSTQAVNIDSSGNMGTITYDAIGQAMTSTGANAIAATRTRATGTTVGAGGVATGAGVSMVYSSTSVSAAQSAITITTSGRPLYMSLKATSAGAHIGAQSTASTTAETSWYFYVAGSAVATQILNPNATGLSQTHSLFVPPSIVNFIHPIAAGTYTVDFRVAVGTAGVDAVISTVALIVYEL